ncbi:caspase family protein [Fertoebacter nigrum]|uniref:Caspase family protein n=1 Tax=Fertoeibacter niger TaxID=2656921 RepID=A0A8X8H5X6_9RHOB|nr:caspase family protein [Fertoeibacter niger]NUB46283.1 caspase family protein [Fertoeibacter niger]
MRRLLLSSALALLALPALSLTALARENHALLIGASTYENLEERFWLKGPANDVALVESYLTTSAPVPFDIGNVTVLADGVPGKQAPTLAAIRAAFADLTVRVQPGDFVYLHFSGHGSQAPAADPDSELDGLDELFLPVDVGPWSDEIGAVENALVDDEIGQMIDALRAKGADVWAVFDSCHSGTVTRAAPSGDDEVRTRQLPPEALGLTEEAMNVTTRALPDPRAQAEAPFDAGEGEGSLVAFFAAQTNEVTPEKNLPKGKAGRKPQGVFTYALFETLAAHPGATYRQIGQEVLRNYAVRNLATATPLFEGDLDGVAFAGTAAPRVAQWPAVAGPDGLTLNAGTLHGLAEGSLLAVMASAADATEAALGYVTVARADTFTATATPTDHAGKTLPPDLAGDLPRGLTLRKIGNDLDFTLTVALPEPGTPAADALLAALKSAPADSGQRLRLVPAGAEADLRLAVIPGAPRPDAVYVLPATGLAENLERTPSISTADKDPETLALTVTDTLAQMARALNVLKLGANVGGDALDVSVDLLTRNPEDKTLRGLPTARVPRLIPDDEVHVEATNNTTGPVDVNVLYVGSDYSITHMFAGRLQAGDTLKQGLLRITDAAYGRDRVVLVMTPAQPQSAVEDLAFLEQDAVSLLRDVSAGIAPPRTGLNAALFEAGFGETTRAAVSLSEDVATGPGPAILQFDLDTVPAD